MPSTGNHHESANFSKPELGDTIIFFGFVLVSCAHEACTLEDYQETNFS